MSDELPPEVLSAFEKQIEARIGDALRKRDIEAVLPRIEPGVVERAKELLNRGASTEEVLALYGKKENVVQPPKEPATQSRSVVDEKPNASAGGGGTSIEDRIKALDKLPFHEAHRLMQSDNELRAEVLRRGFNKFKK